MYLFHHIAAFDRTRHSSNEDYNIFVTAEDLDNSVITKILDNKFRDPLLDNSDSEDEAAEEQERKKTNWTEFWNDVSKKRNNDSNSNIAGHTYVPGLRAVAPYLKLSSLTTLQHYQCLKIISAENKNVPGHCLPRPGKMDYRVFEEVRELYKKEQQEYIAWAKSMWVENHFIRAIRPKPVVEAVYQAEFNMKAHEMQSFPKKYYMVAQIPLEMRNNSIEMIHQKDLVTVDIQKLPQIDCTEMLRRRFSVVRPMITPEPCDEHPCKFILPSEETTSVMPLVEIHRDLAQYASENGAGYVASESALKCLAERDRRWTIPVSVCPIITPDGESNNVIVMGSEFSMHRQPARTRTYRAFRHLLENSLVKQKDKISMQEENFLTKEDKRIDARNSKKMNTSKAIVDDSDNDEDKLIIADDMQIDPNESVTENYTVNDSDMKGLQIDTDSAPDTENANNTIDSKSVVINGRVLRQRKISRASNSGNEMDDTKHNGPVLRSRKESKDNHSENETEISTISGRVSKSRKSSRDSNNSESNSEDDSESCEANRRLLRNSKWSLDDDHNSNSKYKRGVSQTKNESEKNESYYSCNCKELYRRPAPRSFRKWQVRNITSNESYDVIVHCAHKLRDEVGEVIVEPTPEYQIDLGASELLPDSVKRTAVSLLLRKNSSLVNVRVDGPTGDVLMYDKIQLKDITQEHPGVIPENMNTIYTVLDQLQGLKPDYYVLDHEPQHGANAFLYACRQNGSLQLNFSSDPLVNTDESSSVLNPVPVLTPTLMPYHKHRKILPCAFTPNEKEVAKETKKPPVQQAKPPQAIKWPKKKKRSRKSKKQL